MILAITYMLIVSKAQALALSSALKYGLIYLDIPTSMYLSFSKLNMSKEFSTLSTILSSPELPNSLNGNHTQHSHPTRYCGFIVGFSRSNQAASQSNFPHICPCLCPLSISSIIALVQISFAWTISVAFKVVSFTLKSIFCATFRLVCFKYDKLGL